MNSYLLHLPLLDASHLALALAQLQQAFATGAVSMSAMLIVRPSEGTVGTGMEFDIKAFDVSLLSEWRLGSAYMLRVRRSWRRLFHELRVVRDLHVTRLPATDIEILAEVLTLLFLLLRV